MTTKNNNYILHLHCACLNIFDQYDTQHRYFLVILRWFYITFFFPCDPNKICHLSSMTT